LYQTHVRHAGRLRPRDHALRFGAVRPSGFSHSTILPARAARDRDFGVRVVRAGDVDEIDVRAARLRTRQSRFDRLVAPVAGEALARSAFRAQTALSTAVGQFEERGA
jgi:hypothetical protein